MKVGITLKDYFKDYLTKIANLNHISLTKVCSLICENFLSYNLKKKQFPKFRKFVRIEFDEVSKSDSDNSSDSCGSCSDGSVSQQPLVIDDEVAGAIERAHVNIWDVDDDLLPFDSED